MHNEWDVVKRRILDLAKDKAANDDELAELLGNVSLFDEGRT